MPSLSDGEPPASLDAVVTRYRRAERAASWATALFVGLVAAGLIFSLSLWQGLLGAVVVLAIFRVPLFTTGGTARLRTTATPTAVREAFSGSQPPVLALQWAIADTRTTTADGATFDLSYLLGLRSITMSTTVAETPAANSDFELRVTAGDKPWGTYRVTLTDEVDATRIEIDVRSDRRFGLRGLPSWLIAQRYYDAALAAHGYTVCARDRSLSLRR